MIFTLSLKPLPYKPKIYAAFGLFEAYVCIVNAPFITRELNFRNFVVRGRTQLITTSIDVAMIRDDIVARQPVDYHHSEPQSDIEWPL